MYALSRANKSLGSVNRSQTEVQKTVGSPAQSTSLSDLIARVDMSSLKIDALDKRMDALQSVSFAIISPVNHTHASPSS